MLALRLLLLGCGATVAVGQQARAGEAAASLRAAEEERVQIGPGDNYDDVKVPAAPAGALCCWNKINNLPDDEKYCKTFTDDGCKVPGLT